MYKNDRYYYLVEGECEKKLVDVLKEQKNIIVPGKVSRFNVVDKRLTSAFLRTISSNTTIILVFDTDTNNTNILSENIKTLKQNKGVKQIWYVTQVYNIEDEIVRSTDLNRAQDLFGCESLKEYKRLFIKEKRLYEKLLDHKFNIESIWNKSPEGIFKIYANSGYKIKRAL